MWRWSLVEDHEGLVVFGHYRNKRPEGSFFEINHTLEMSEIFLGFSPDEQSGHVTPFG